jgi:hypothetical protein
MPLPRLSELFARLLSAEERGPTAWTVEAFGWLILVEGAILVFAPGFVAAVLHLPTLSEQAANYFRLVGMFVSGLGMLYVVSGRLNATGFLFASLLDRPLVPFAMAVLWYVGIVPGPLALLFSIQAFGSFLWTLLTWRAESRRE